LAQLFPHAPVEVAFAVARAVKGSPPVGRAGGAGQGRESSRWSRVVAGDEGDVAGERKKKGWG
jgi:hypothetical protein